ncbi:hypothetical protein [Anaeromicrobium sediminis]|uniref:Uncharacterized protein n=1 Tax=Anaeromicrobium sediminis TaxID=1478221 RepID=A0A267MNH4_9FIRM|nr:hypothetical protein [Anaeromicrobium sediminis]PAB60383.1 hypothetical protein CCE28_05670 [Anaeromicrobium sediminis]
MTNSEDKNKEKKIIDQQKIQEELNEIKVQYSSLSKEINAIQNNEKAINDLKQRVETINKGLEQLNKNIQEISGKLNRMPNMHKTIMRKKGMIRRAFRRGAIKTVEAFFCVADATAEKACCIKEGVEDIVAEAQYENQKRRMNLNENNC